MRCSFFFELLSGKQTSTLQKFVKPQRWAPTHSGVDRAISYLLLWTTFWDIIWDFLLWKSKDEGKISEVLVWWLLNWLLLDCIRELGFLNWLKIFKSYSSWLKSMWLQSLKSQGFMTFELMTLDPLSWNHNQWEFSMMFIPALSMLNLPKSPAQKLTWMICRSLYLIFKSSLFSNTALFCARF